MANVEKYLHEHFANAAVAAESTPGAAGSSAILPDSETQTLDQPFAKVDSVASSSPAEQAGLKVGDEIRNFGYVNRANNDGLKKVAECVQGNEGVRSVFWSSYFNHYSNTIQQSNIFIRVSRPSGVASREELRLTLTPRRNWGGRGMLGCHITPL